MTALPENAPAPPAPPGMLLLDRDGTINREVHYLSDPNEVDLLPGAAEAIRRVRKLGWKAVVVTNQTGLARGYFDEATLEAIHERLRALLLERGAELDALYYCPHLPEEECDCRKPKTGLLERAARELGVPLERSVMVGDKPADIGAGRNAGIPTVLVRTGYGAETEAAAGQRADLVVDDLGDVADWLERGS